VPFDTTIDLRLPPRILHHPMRRAFWRVLLCPAGEIAAQAREGQTLIDMIALTAVQRALEGDLKALGIIYEVIEGRIPMPRKARPRHARRRQLP
jgi:hypothetical protein